MQQAEAALYLSDQCRVGERWPDVSVLVQLIFTF